MVSVSLMPPVDYCASCEGKKAESQARDVAFSRAAEATDQASRPDFEAQPPPGALPSRRDEAQTKPVDTVARPLLSPDLAVQASLANVDTLPTAPGDNPMLRLQAFQAYGAAPGRGSGSPM